MKLPHPYDLIIGLDRSDKKADLCLLNTTTDQRQFALIDTSPEALWEWLLQLRQAYPQARVALCLEQPAGHLIAFLEAYEWITLFPINPITLQKFRETFVTSREGVGPGERVLTYLALNRRQAILSSLPPSVSSFTRLPGPTPAMG
jgi:hypothetical protein